MWQIRPPEELDHLADVDTTSTAPTDGQALVFDDGSGLWVPGDGGGGGSVAVDDDGTEVTAAASRLNFGDNLTVTDDGGGAVTIDASGGGGGGGGAGTFCDLFGDDVETTIDVVHDLGTSCVQVGVVEVASGDALVHGTDYTWLILDDDTVRLVFSSAPDTDDARVVVLASGGGGGGGGGAVGSRVHKSNTTHTTNNPIQWTDVDYDDLGIINLGTSTTEFTIAEAGLYHIALNALTSTADNLVQIMVDGDRVTVTRYASGGSVKGHNHNWMGKLAANQVVSTEVGGSLVTATGFTQANLTWLTITKLA